ncbi:MAG: hypothetical protein EA397_10440 [Deltaproteobacteria bacterium]|nr:MAG: hypothetical protein EA397_10440 [Deltaproteobacteria bacterium]
MPVIQLTATLGAEHALSDGRLIPFTASPRVSATPLRTGDRAWIDAELVGVRGAWVIVQHRDFSFEIWSSHMEQVPSHLLPEGHTVGRVPWRLWVVAAAEPIAWLDDASGEVDCTRYASEVAPQAPVDLCGFLAGLPRLAPPSSRSGVEPARPRPPGARNDLPTGQVRAGEASLRGFTASHSGSDAVAVVFSVEQR